MQKANKEHWKQDRDKTVSKTIAKVQQKTADAVSENVAIAQRIKAKLLRRLEREIDKLPENIGSEYVTGGVEYGKNEKGNRIRKEVTHAYKLRDLTAAYKDLTDDMPKEEDSTTIEKLDELLEVAWNAAHTETG